MSLEYTLHLSVYKIVETVGMEFLTEVGQLVK